MPVPSVETKIAEAIRARVDTLPMIGVYDLVYTQGDGSLVTGSGALYTPSPTKPYLRVTITPNRTGRPFIGSTEPHTIPGIVQIDVMDTKARGTGVARETAGQVKAHFRTDMKMTFMGVKVRVTDPPSVYGPFVDTHIQVPVEIRIETNA